jgi:hypothetical protein
MMFSFFYPLAGVASIGLDIEGLRTEEGKDRQDRDQNENLPHHRLLLLQLRQPRA